MVLLLLAYLEVNEDISCSIKNVYTNHTVLTLLLEGHLNAVAVWIGVAYFLPPLFLG